MSLPAWLSPASAQLLAAQRAGRLPAALLVHEDPGAGGGQLALQFALQLLCREPLPDGSACGACARCRRVLAREHPDLHHVVPDPELKSGQITVDQVREVSATLSMTAYEGGATLVVIRPAEAMNRQACNALLKTLEEPRPGAYLLLLTSQPSRLPATVRSRCLVLRAPAPSRQQALEWLRSQRDGDWEAALDVLGEAPLDALEHDPARLRTLRDEVWQVLAEAATGRLDIVRVADRWAKDELPLRVSALENCLTRCALAAAGGGETTAEMRRGTHLPAAIPAMNIATALRLLDGVRELRFQLGTSLNKPLAVERQLWRLGGAGLAR